MVRLAVFVLVVVVLAGCGRSGDDEGPPVVLHGDGLGAEDFGAPVDRVIAALTLRWAPPDEDSSWVPAAASAFGACPGSEVRVVEWRGFRVFFSDGPTPYGPAGVRHFFSWDYHAPDRSAPGPDPGGYRPPLATEAGISIGAPVDALHAAYGERLELSAAGAGPSFAVRLPEGAISGVLTGDGAGDVVASIAGGAGCRPPAPPGEKP